MTLSYRTLAALLVLGACVPAPPAPPRTTTETTVDASYAKTWDALIDYLTTQRIPIKITDRASGLVQTDLASLPKPPYGQERQYADCSTTAGIANYPTYVSATFVVRAIGADSSHASVKSTARFNRERGDDCVSLGRLEEAWEHEVRDRAEGKASP